MYIRLGCSRRPGAIFRQIASLTAKLGLSVGLIWYATRDLDMGAAAARVAQLPWGYVAASFAMFGGVVLNNAIRWQLVLRAVGAWLPLELTFSIFYVGLFFNQVLPSSIGGDAFRMFLVYKTGTKLRGAVNSVLLERVATLMGLVLLVVATQPLILSRIGDGPARYLFPVMVVAGVAGIAILMLLDQFPARIKAWRAMRAVVALAEDTRRLFLAPRYGVAAIALGIIGFSLISLTVYLLAQGLGINLGLIESLALVPPVLLITTIPISIAGWGVREAAMVFALGLVGIDRDSAVLLSLIFGTLGLIGSLPGALFWIRTGFSRHDVASDIDRRIGPSSRITKSQPKKP